MSTAVTKHLPTERAPEAASLALIDTMRSYRSKIEWHASGHYSISELHVPTDQDRAAMVARRVELVTSLQAADPRAVAQKVAQAFLRFPSSRMPDGVAQATVAAYAVELAKYPLWVIDGGFMVVINGKGSASFVPSAMEWRAACEQVAQPIRKEIAEIDRVLNAAVMPEVSEETRARVLAGFQELLSDLRLNDPFVPSSKGVANLTRDESAARLEALKECPEPLPAMSPGLAKLMGLSPAASMPGAAE